MSGTVDPHVEPTPLKRALVAVQDLTARLEAIEGARRQPIAIVGMACRFPGGAADPERFWELLHAGVDAVGTVPSDRWDADTHFDPDPETPGKMYTASGGFLAEPVDRFDADFFGISPREALGIDPQHRLLLELSWEALEQGGIDPASLRGTRTGVFIGISSNDYSTRRLLAGATQGTDAYAATGSAFSVAAGRISYLLGLQGPSFALDAACASSVVAIAQAVQSLRDGSSDLALVGGVNLMLAPESTVAMCKLRALSPSGRCRSFAASADGYVRGEGGGVLVLKRLSDSYESGDLIQAVIRGAAVNHDGRSSGLTVPNVAAQQAVIRAALKDAGVTADRVDYLEAMGTGTALGDAIELRAVDAVYGTGRDSSRPLRLGSVKTNIGHLEAASGMASVIKLILALRYEEIPPHLHLDEPSSHIDWDALPLEIPNGRTPWQQRDGPRLGAVSSFSFSGTNGHLVIEEAPLTPASVAVVSHSTCVLPLSAHSPEALRDVAIAYESHLTLARDPLQDICFTAGTGRTHLRHRLAVVGRSTSDLTQGLRSFLLGEPHPRVFTGEASEAPTETVDLHSVEASMSRDHHHTESACSDVAGDESLLTAMGALYTTGALIDWSSVYREREVRRVVLPTYPFQRERFWSAEDGRSATTRGDQSFIHVAKVVQGEELASELRVRRLSGGRKRGYLVEYLRGRVALVLGSGSTHSLKETRPLAELGLDSLMILELRNAVLRDLGIDLPQRQVFEGSLASLSEWLELAWTDGATATASPLLRVSRELPLPLSLGQQRLWILHELDPDSTAYRIVVTIELKGTLQPTALELALGEIQRRHEVLRTSFVVGKDGPTQVVQSPQPFALSNIDLGDITEAERELEIARLSRAETRVPFDLQRGPLLRALLVRLTGSEHRLVLCLHHIVSDGWSVRVLLRELSALYPAMLAGAPSPLPELSVQYADYSAWQRQYLDDELLGEQLGYWRAQLAELPVLDPPTDRPRPAVRRHSSGTVSAVLGEELSANLVRFSQEQGVTLFMTLLAGFQLLLSRLSGQDDFAIGSPTVSRNRAELENLIGFFMNTLVLRCDLTGDPSFTTLVRRVREVTLGAFANQDVPFERLVEELAPPRDLSRSPLVQVLFNMLPGTGGEEFLRLGELDATVTSDLNVGAKFDLTLYVQQGKRLRLDLLYDTDLYDEIRVAEMLRQYEHLLEQVIARPESSVSRHSLVTKDAESLLPNPCIPLGFEWRDSIPSRVAAWASIAPDRVALRDTQESWSYAELHAAAGGVGNSLTAAGVGRGDVVAILATRQSALPVVLLGAMQTGAAFLILDPAHPPARLAACLRLANAKVMIDMHECESGDRRLHEEMDGLAARIRLPLRKATLLATAGNPVVDIDLTPEDTAYIAFTSGTTGEPKGIVGGHAPLSHFLGWHARTFALTEADRFSVLSGLSHDPLLRDLFAPLWVGATACIVDARTRAEPRELLAWMRQEGITVSHLTPAMGEVLAGADTTFEPGVLSSLRLACFGGDVLSPNLVRAMRTVAPNARCINFYGTTETPQVMSFAVVDADLTGPAPLGNGIADAQLLVLTRANLQAGVGELGEICVRSPYLARGYLAEDPLIQQRFVAHPISNDPTDRVYRTGDLGRYLPDGTVAFAGRHDVQVKIRGYRVDPREVEAVLAAQPGVSRCAVIARTSDAGPAQLHAFVLPASAPSADLRRDLQIGLKAVLPPEMIPGQIVFIDTLPLTPSGKLDRASLMAWAAANVREEPSTEPPRTPIEEIIGSVWQDLLGVEAIDVHQSFYDLGGHSLLAMQVVSRLRAALHVDLPLRALFEAPTIAGLAEQVLACRRAGLQNEVPPLVPGNRLDPVPLSFAQERLWVLQQMDPTSTAYNLHGHVRIRGALDAAALRNAFDEVMRRQDGLRTVFRETDGRPVQVVLDPMPFPMECIDLSGVEDDVRQQELDSLRRRASRLTFDVSEGPLCRAWLVCVGEDEHELLLTLHHIVTDGWSLRVLMRELHALYQFFSGGIPTALPELTVQYVDYASWQRRWLRGELLESQLAYWREQLADLPTLTLPSDRPRPALQTYGGSVEEIELSSELSEGIRRLAREESSTLFMTLLTAFKLVVSRLAAQEDVVVGTPIAGRTRQEVEPLIGYFLNNLVLRTNLSGDPSVRELLRRVRDTTLGAYAHQDVPFEKVVEELQPERDLSRTPLFQVCFNMLPDFATEHLRLGDAVAEVVASSDVDAKFDLTLYASVDEGISLRLVYNTDLFDRSSAIRLLEHLNVVLGEMVRHPDRRVSTVPLLTPDRRRQIASAVESVELTVPYVPFPARAAERSIPARFAYQVRTRGDALAIDDGEARWSYAELDRRVNRIAAGLRARLGDGEGRVALFYEHDASMLAAVLGVLSAGKAYVPLDPQQPSERLRYMVAEAGASAVLCDSRHLDAAAEFSAGVPVLDARQFMEDDLELQSSVEISPDSLAYILFTSGTTGEPKGVMQSHRNVLHHIRTYVNRLHIGAHDRVSLLASYGFDAAVMDIFGALLTGATVCPIDLRSDAALDLSAALRERRITVYHSTPTVFRHLIGTVQSDELASVRLVVLGGEEASLRDLESFRRHFSSDAVLVNGLGPTECTLALQYIIGRDGQLPAHVLPVGEPVDGVQIRVLNAAGEQVEAYAIGEIVIRSEHLALGYWRRPQETAAAFQPDPHGGNSRLFRTGDLGRMLPDGRIAFAGRKDRQVKIRGIRVELAEIESCLLRIEGIREAAVIERTAESGEPRLAAYVVGDLTMNGQPTAVLRARLGRYLPAYMIPSEVVVVDRLPLTTNGKLDRRALAAMDVLLPAPGNGKLVPPSTPMEVLIAALWTELLGVQEPGVDDNFYDLGGHSLLAVRFASRFRDHTGVRLDLRELTYQTLGQIAAVYEASGGQRTPSGLSGLLRRMIGGSARSDASTVAS